MSWPKHIILFEPEDFMHGVWANGRARKGFDAGEMEGAVTMCGSRFCLGGAAAAAFNEPSFLPNRIGKPETAEFLRAVCRHLDRPIPVNGDVFQTVRLASDAFEGYGRFRMYPPVTPEEAARAWREAACDFGYDVDNAK